MLVAWRVGQHRFQRWFSREPTSTMTSIRDPAPMRPARQPLPSSTTRIQIVGPREIRALDRREILCVDTTAKTGWSAGLSPFVLGPCALYGGRTASVMENAYQFSKVYPDHLDADGNPGAAYWAWAEEGWRDPVAHRYPRGKGAKPAYAWWDGQKLGYLEARLQIYFTLYRDAVAGGAAFRRLQTAAREHDAIALFDFDGFDHDAAGMSLAEAFLVDRRPVGHAFVLKAMLLLGEDVTPDVVAREAGLPDLRHQPRQASLL